MNKVNFYFIFLQALLMVSTLTCSKTSNILFTEDSENPFGRANSVLLGDIIIYQTTGNDESKLWAYDTTNHVNSQLFTGHLSQFSYSNYIYRIDNHAFFIGGSDYNFQFWRTDGTPSGTVQLDSPSLFPAHGIADGVLVSWSSQGTLLSTDGEEVVEHQIENPLNYNVCAFDSHDLIATKDGLSNVGDASIVRSNNGVISVLSEGFPEAIQIAESNSFRMGNNCFLLINGLSEEFKELLVIAKEGEVKRLSEKMDLSQISSIFAFENQLYSINKDSQSDFLNSINRFNPAMNGYDAQFSLSSGFSFNSITTSADYIMAQSTTPTASPAINELTFLNENLQPIDNLGGLFVRTPNIHPTADGEWYGLENYVNNVSAYTLSSSISFEGGETLVTSNYLLNDVITSTDSSEIFLRLRDKITGQAFFAQVAETPNINASTAGIWHDPNIQNQGVVINKGQRANGSSYLFVAVYTMVMGEPLWLAGNADISLPQPYIEVNLTQFEGTDFFEPDVDTTQTPWGSVKLEMTSCDGLKTTFYPIVGTARAINLLRIDNTSFNSLCSD